MNILHVTFDTTGYGITTFLLNLIKYQNLQSCYEAVHLALHKKDQEVDEFKGSNIIIHCADSKTARNLKIVSKFYKLFKDYDVINFHTHSPWAFLAAILAKKKIVYIFHGAIGLKGNWVDIFIKLFHRLIILNFSDKITFASKSSLKRYSETIGKEVKIGKIEIFPYGLAVNKIKSKKGRAVVRNELEVDNKFVIGTVARLDPMKRIDRLIEAFALLPDKPNLELLIIGSGGITEENYLKGLVTNYGIENYVRFMGYRSDAIDLINSFDLFVLPSRNEPFGLALLEAMALGIPSVVFEDGGGAVDILGESGIIVKNTRELRDIIINTKDNYALMRRISKQVEKRASVFDIKYVAEKFKTIYASLYPDKIN